MDTTTQDLRKVWAFAFISPPMKYTAEPKRAPATASASSSGVPPPPQAATGTGTDERRTDGGHSDASSESWVDASSSSQPTEWTRQQLIDATLQFAAALGTVMGAMMAPVKPLWDTLNDLAVRWSTDLASTADKYVARCIAEAAAAQEQQPGASEFILWGASMCEPRHYAVETPAYDAVGVTFNCACLELQLARSCVNVACSYPDAPLDKAGQLIKHAYKFCCSAGYRFDQCARWMTKYVEPVVARRPGHVTGHADTESPALEALSLVCLAEAQLIGLARSVASSFAQTSSKAQPGDQLSAKLTMQAVTLWERAVVAVTALPAEGVAAGPKRALDLLAPLSAVHVAALLSVAHAISARVALSNNLPQDALKHVRCSTINANDAVDKAGALAALVRSYPKALEVPTSSVGRFPHGFLRADEAVNFALRMQHASQGIAQAVEHVITVAMGARLDAAVERSFIDNGATTANKLRFAMLPGGQELARFKALESPATPVAAAGTAPVAAQ